MLNKLTKSQVIMALTALRDKTILDSKDLEWAINFIEEQDDDIRGKK